MKKIFSLLLVAVLLVGMLPFQASAVETVPYTVYDMTDGNAKKGEGTIAVGVSCDPNTLMPANYKFSVGYCYAGGVMENSISGAFDPEAGKTYAFFAEPVHVHTPGAEATCTTAQTCTGCGETMVAALGHNYADATCVAPKTCSSCGATDGSALGHDVVDGVCTRRCGYVEPKVTVPVQVVINNSGTGKTFTVDADKSASEVFAAFQASSIAAQYPGAEGPVVTLADSNAPVAAVEAGKSYWLWLSWTNSSDDETVDPPAGPQPERKAINWEIKNAEGGPVVNSGSFTPNGETAAAKDILYYHVFGKTTAWKDQYVLDPMKVWSSKQGKDIGYNGTVAEGDTVTFVLVPKDNSTESTAKKVKVYMNLNYADAYDYHEKMTYVWADRNALLKDVVAGIPEPSRDKHNFKYWTTDQAGVDVINDYCDARATADGVIIYAQWADIVQSTEGNITLRVNLNYDFKMGDPVTNIVWGARMGNVLEYVAKPFRANYKFMGWYWDYNCTNPVKISDRIFMNSQVFAKWERRFTNNEIMLKVYLNGNTQSVFQIIDMYNYALDDGHISISEIQTAVKKFYTAKDSNGMYFEGPFDTDDWAAYVRNPKNGGIQLPIPVDVGPESDDTIIYVMVHNAKVRTTINSSSSSSATADSSNPKTGDAIMTPVIVLTASVGALATLYYLNKKRSI